MKAIPALCFFLFCTISLKAQTADLPKSWTPDPLEDSIKKYEMAGKYEVAMGYAEQWLEKAKKIPGKDSLDYAAVLNARGNLLRNRNRPKEAERAFQKSLEIRKKVLGPEHREVALLLNSLGVLYRNLGDYPKAESFFLQALEIRKKILGPEHKEVAHTIHSLGLLYRSLGENSKAEPLLLKALQIRKKVLGPDHPDVANSYNNLGILYFNSGDYAKAEPFYLDALKIRKKTLGSEHPDVAINLLSLGNLYHVLGDYSKAELSYTEAQEISRKSLGPEHSDVALSLTSLGNLYSDLGEFSKAKPLLLQALEIQKNAWGSGHADVASSFNNLGILFFSLGDFAKAEHYYLQAVDICKKTMGPDHPNVAVFLCNLGIIYDKLGIYNKAEIYIRQALEIRKKVFKVDHPMVANSLINLGVLYKNTGDFAKAESMYLQALEIDKKALGTQHPEVGITLFNLGVLFRSQKNRSAAVQNFNELANLDRKLILQYFPSMSEQGREAYLKTGLEKTENLKSFLSEEGLKTPVLRGELWNHQLFYKGLLLNTRARWKQRLVASRDTNVLQRLEDWVNLQYKISGLFASTDTAVRSGLDSLVEKAAKLEKELSLMSEELAPPEERKVVTWQEVQKALKPGEAAVEMVRFRHFGIARLATDTTDPNRPTYRVKGLTDTVQYAALILTKTSLHPDLVILPEGNAMEGKWQRFYRKSVRLHQKDTESYKRYWQAIGQKLRGIKKVWFSADGVYHKLNLGTLKNPSTGKYLAEEQEIALLGSTKDLLKKYPEESKNRLACLVGNPAFEPVNPAAEGNFRSVADTTNLPGIDPNMKADLLPGTAAEVKRIAGLLSKKGWQVQEYTGAEATEKKIKESTNPRVMLVSTHGFFRADTTPGSNPLLRSGLLLSGAAKTLREGHRGEGEDGILTAYEAMNLNLDNTELVVLSACETGLGEIKNGEGVYGLQRAFQVAGARNLIMSLWKVDDAVTKDLMVAFFRNWLGAEAAVGTSGQTAGRMAKGPDDLRTAFRKAQLEIRKKHPEPYYWGAFVMLGR